MWYIFISLVIAAHLRATWNISIIPAKEKLTEEEPFVRTAHLRATWTAKQSYVYK